MEAVPIISTGLFAGAALAVSVAEHPARMAIGLPEARKQFQQSYDRIAPVQIALALASSAGSFYMAHKGGENSKIYLGAGLTMLAMLPYTVTCIFPTNHELQSSEKKEDKEVMRLFKKWEKLHAVRTVVSVATFAVLATAALAGRQRA